MTRQSNYETSAGVDLPGADAICDRLAEHFGEHGAVTREAGAVRLDAGTASAVLRASPSRVELQVRADTAYGLYGLKASLVAHLSELSGQRLRIAWAGSVPTPTSLPYFREMTVVAAQEVTPRMRRVTLAGDAGHFAGPGGLHCRLVMPPAGRVPVWPRPSEDGRIIWPEGEDALVVRIYTIRRLVIERGHLDIDFVIHAGADTPGSDWALAASPGQVVGLTGPGGGDAASSDRLLLAGDETALPAIARILERLPETCAATVRVEVADAAEEQPLPTRAALDLEWLHRNGAGAGTTDLLETSVRALDWPGAEPGAFAWVGCEAAGARAIRRHLREERGVGRKQQLVAAYWRRGIDGLSAHEQDGPDET